MILLLKDSLHLIHNGPPCLLMLWCFFKKQTPIKSGGLNSQLRGSFLRLCGFWMTSAKYETRMTLPLERRRRKGTGDAPVRSLIYTTTVFLYSYFMCYSGMKGIFFSLRSGGAGYGWLSGHTAHNKMRRRGWGGAAFLDSKHQNSPHKQRRSISLENVRLSPV